MSSIILVRHGPVALNAPGLLSRDQFLRYVDAYEGSGLRPDARPPEALGRLVRDSNIGFASAAPRVAESLKLLHAERTAVIDPLFGEEPNVAPRLAGRWPLIVWFALSRGAGAFHPNEADARQAMRNRAEQAAGLLIASAERGTVALIGHGWFNRAIARTLAVKGWRRRADSGGSTSWGRVSPPWGHAVFR